MRKNMSLGEKEGASPSAMGRLLIQLSNITTLSEHYLCLKFNTGAT